jgi:hypothetical protein
MSGLPAKRSKRKAAKKFATREKASKKMETGTKSRKLSMQDGCPSSLRASFSFGSEDAEAITGGTPESFLHCH